MFHSIWSQFPLFLFRSLLNDAGSMLDVIKHQKKRSNCEDGVLDEAVIASVLREVLKGLDYFHSQGLIHRYILKQWFA